jgi:hypothetical protein
MIRIMLVAILACALACACASGPTLSDARASVPVLAAGKARIYFYRTGIVGAAYQPEVTLNGAVVGKAAPRGVYFRDVAPGHYAVTTRLTRKVVEFDVAAGQKMYVRMDYSFGFNIDPELIQASVGEREISELSFVPAPEQAAQVPPAATAPAPQERSYVGSLRCGAYEGTGTVEFPGPWVAPIRMTVTGAQVRMQRSDGRYSESLTGSVDGSNLSLAGRGAMYATPNAYWVTSVKAAYSAEGTRVDGSAQLAESTGRVFRRCTVDLALTPASSTRTRAGATWEAWIRQRDALIPLADTVTLQRAPFSIVFRAPSGHALAVLGSAERAELLALVKPDLGGSVRPTNIAAEARTSDLNTDLLVNAAGLVARDSGSAQLWYDDPAEPHASFQAVAKGDGEWTSTRQIRSLCLQARDQVKCTPVAASSVSGLSLLLAGVAPGAAMRFVAPRVVTIRFQ